MLSIDDQMEANSGDVRRDCSELDGPEISCVEIRRSEWSSNEQDFAETGRSLIAVRARVRSDESSRRSLKAWSGCTFSPSESADWLFFANKTGGCPSFAGESSAARLLFAGAIYIKTSTWLVLGAFLKLVPIIAAIE